jgi:nucleoside-diphosphate-sugar epimerase
MPQHSLVTGVTGFVGSHLAYRLLEEGHHVTALARGGRNASPRDRVIEVLSQVAGSAEGLNAHLDHLDVIEGDISQPLLALTQTPSETRHRELMMSGIARRPSRSRTKNAKRSFT